MPCSRRGQEATSGEDSPMAKPKPLVPAKARPLNLVARSPWSEKNSSQNPVNADERKGVEIASGNSWLQTASKSEIVHSQVSRQEKALRAERNLCMEQLQNQRDQRALSNSKNPRKPVQGATPRPEFQNMKCTNHQYTTKIPQFLPKKLGIAASYSIFSMEA